MLLQTRMLAYESVVNYTSFVVVAERVASRQDMQELLSSLSKMTHEEKSQRRQYMLQAMRYLNYDDSATENAFSVAFDQMESRAHILNEFRTSYGKQELNLNIKTSSMF